jgi:hypothetical protein
MRRRCGGWVGAVVSICRIERWISKSSNGEFGIERPKETCRSIRGWDMSVHKTSVGKSLLVGVYGETIC